MAEASWTRDPIKANLAIFIEKWEITLNQEMDVESSLNCSKEITCLLKQIILKFETFQKEQLHVVSESLIDIVNSCCKEIKLLLEEIIPKFETFQIELLVTPSKREFHAILIGIVKQYFKIIKIYLTIDRLLKDGLDKLTK